jgi:hypothetical protein
MKTIKKHYPTELGARRKQKTLTVSLMLSKNLVYQSGNVFHRKGYVWTVVRNNNILLIKVGK